MVLKIRDQFIKFESLNSNMEIIGVANKKSRKIELFRNPKGENLLV
jgi:hypothetical protein